MKPERRDDLRCCPACGAVACENTHASDMINCSNCKCSLHQSYFEQGMLVCEWQARPDEKRLESAILFAIQSLGMAHGLTEILGDVLNRKPLSESVERWMEEGYANYTKLKEITDASRNNSESDHKA